MTLQELNEVIAECRRLKQGDTYFMLHSWGANEWLAGIGGNPGRGEHQLSQIGDTPEAAVRALLALLRSSAC